MYGVCEGDEAQWYSSAEWAEEGWAEEEEEHAGAVYDEDDEMIATCCACVCFLEPPMSESDDPFMCVLSDENCEEHAYAISFLHDAGECDEELIANTYRGLRDVDGWQRRDPWGGSAGDVPKRSMHASTCTIRSTP